LGTWLSSGLANKSNRLPFGVMTTPALVVDGTLKASGRLLTAEKIKAFLA
jgi:hypothetical protein